jgi:N-acetylmuramoyl-L-alanine amidase
MPFELHTIMATKSPCYKEARPMKAVGIVVHSTGANNPELRRYVQPDDGNIGINKYANEVNREDWRVIAHAYIGRDKNGIVKCYQVLPFDIACWSAGQGSNGSYNYNPQGHIQFEICEDNLKDEKYFNEAFSCAAEFCAYLCKEYNLSVDSICSHKEAHKAGYTSNHGDPENWLSKFGKDMDWFRDKVNAILKKETEDQTRNDKLYRVQVGAFSNKKFAENLVKDLKVDGYNAFIVEEDIEPTPQPKTLKKGDRVRIQDNAPIWATNKPFAPFVYDMDVYIMEIDGDRIVFSVNAKDITGAVDKMYIE